jgi:hypothetical protein
MKHCYLVVNEDFRNAFQGTQKAASILTTATTTDGRIVVSTNAINEFQDVFFGIGQDTFPIAWLTPDDFPQMADTPGQSAG